MKGIRIGELLVEQGILTPKQVEHILFVQKRAQRPFGDLAEKLFGIDPKAIEDAWVQQYIRLAGVVDLDQQRIDEGCRRSRVTICSLCAQCCCWFRAHCNCSWFIVIILIEQ